MDARGFSGRPVAFAVHDRITGATGHKLTWHWRLADAPWQIGVDGQCVEVQTAEWSYAVRWSHLAGCRARLLRADESTAFGWWSPYYSAVEPACALLIETNATGDVELVTQFCPLG